MLLIINGNDDLKMDKDIFNSTEYIVFESFCDVKYYENLDYIIILNKVEVGENGYVERLSFFLEELLISLKVKAIITNTINDKLIEICKFHNIFLVSI